MSGGAAIPAVELGSVEHHGYTVRYHYPIGWFIVDGTPALKRNYYQMRSSALAAVEERLQLGRGRR